MPHWSWDGLQVARRPDLRSGGARLATTDDTDAVVRILALGFATDPVWGLWALPDTADRARVMERYWRPFVVAAMEYGGVFVAPQLEAVSIWVPPGVPEMDDANEEVFLAVVDEIFGDRAALLFGAFEAFSENREPIPPHWYLSLLATDPDHRGSGLGMRLVTDVLADVVDAAGLPAYLESTNDANLARYAAAGFERHGAFSVPDGPDGDDDAAARIQLAPAARPCRAGRLSADSIRTPVRTDLQADGSGCVRVLGVDPGLTRCGLGVVEGVPGRKLAHGRGRRRTHPAGRRARRSGCVLIERAMEDWLDRYEPDAVAVERVFSQHNVRTVMGTAQASAVAIVAAARRGIPVALHTPSEVKAAVTGSGRAEKAQVGAMVTRLLGLTEQPTPGRRGRRARARDLPRLARRLASAAQGGCTGRTRRAAR